MDNNAADAQKNEPVPPVVFGQVVLATVVGAQSMDDPPAAGQPPQPVLRVEEQVSGLPATPGIHQSPIYILCMFVVCAVNTALILWNLITRYTSETPGDEEDGPIPDDIQFLLQSVFTIIFVLDASLGFYTFRMNYLREHPFHIIVAIIGIIDTFVAGLIAVDITTNMWGITGLKVLCYIRPIRRIMRTRRSWGGGNMGVLNR